MTAPTAPTILRRKQVEARTGLSRSAIYAKLTLNPNRPNEHDPTFPRPVRISARAVGWIAEEVDAWLASRIAASRTVAAPTAKRKAAESSAARS